MIRTIVTLLLLAKYLNLLFTKKLVDEIIYINKCTTGIGLMEANSFHLN